MNIPHCYDPVYQEERRQMELDKLHDSLTCCTLCNRTLYPGDKIHIAHNQLVCKHCFMELEENVETVEQE